jgi:alpha-galactosidase
MNHPLTRREKMLKIAFLGAGSLGFGPRLVSDILSFPELVDSTIHLVDPASERLEFIASYVRRMVKEANLPTQIVASTERESALDGANYVIASIRVGQFFEPETLDIMIPHKVGGLRQTVSDTVGVGGIMKGLRTIPPMLDCARDMERLCPKAMLLNYTNPMAMIMWAISEATKITSVGLCHSVQGTSQQLANYMGVEYNRMRYRVAGINHLAWFLELCSEGKDLYPLLRDCLNNTEIFAKDPVRFEIMKHFGYFVTESSTHMAEYVPYFMAHTEEMERLNIRFRVNETDLNEEVISQRREQHQKRLAERQKQLEEQPAKITRSHEYAAEIIHAIETDTTTRINASVPNTGLITNLLQGCSVEVPCLIDGSGLHPCYVGALPSQCASLCQGNVNMQGLTVKAILEQNREHVYHAAMVDPNTSAQMTLPQIRETMDKLIESQRDMMPPL